ncbi:MAG: hydrogenase maturation nickel metallochaperone HypA [Vallitalea sp.]|jgi:rubrerythrin|nr:hydrogenase maturation nickel metallochaperone HypA [Vallitalea sp.]
MHEGCSGSFENGKQVVDKVRMMGFSLQPMPMPLTIECEECGDAFEMETFEDKCPHCGMVYGVTPCHAFDPDNVMAAGIGY